MNHSIIDYYTYDYIYIFHPIFNFTNITISCKKKINSNNNIKLIFPFQESINTLIKKNSFRKGRLGFDTIEKKRDLFI